MIHDYWLLLLLLHHCNRQPLVVTVDVFLEVAVPNHVTNKQQFYWRLVSELCRWEHSQESPQFVRLDLVAIIQMRKLARNRDFVCELTAVRQAELVDLFGGFRHLFDTNSRWVSVVFCQQTRWAMSETIFISVARFWWWILFFVGALQLLTTFLIPTQEEQEQADGISGKWHGKKIN